MNEIKVHWESMKAEGLSLTYRVLVLVGAILLIVLVIMTVIAFISHMFSPTGLQ